MPGFVHVDEQRITALYRYLGGTISRFGNFGNRRTEPKMPEGPVVASGGATVKPDAKTVPPMSNYPAGVVHPKNRYSTDSGNAWPDLLGPTWAWVIAYDLNTGTVKWKQPLGEDLKASKAGDKTTG